MTKMASVDKTSERSAEAFGHPCTEPAPGRIQPTETIGMTITNKTGTTKQVSTQATSELYHPPHAHDKQDGDCVDIIPHYITTNITSSVKRNGSPIHRIEADVEKDPGTGQHVDIHDSGINNSITISPAL